MSVSGELSAESNGVTTKVSADGSHVRWDLVDADAVLSGQTLAINDLARTGDFLRQTGVLVSIEEGGRRLIDVGATRSILGRAIFGSSSIRPRAPFRLLALKRRLGRLPAPHRSFQ